MTAEERQEAKDSLPMIAMIVGAIARRTKTTFDDKAAKALANFASPKHEDLLDDLLDLFDRAVA